MVNIDYARHHRTIVFTVQRYNKRGNQTPAPPYVRLTGALGDAMTSLREPGRQYSLHPANMRTSLAFFTGQLCYVI